MLGSFYFFIFFWGGVMFILIFSRTNGCLLNYTYENLTRYSLSSLQSRRDSLCVKLFNNISNPSHNLYRLLPPRRVAKYSLKRSRVFDLPRSRTNQHGHSFIPTVQIAHYNLAFVHSIFQEFFSFVYKFPNNIYIYFCLEYFIIRCIFLVNYKRS